jgi:formylglycine-generating enzyme required for sulfatase activity
MSEFELDFQVARRRQQRLYTYTFLAFICVTILLVGVLVSTTGTTIKILPVEAEETGTIRVVEGYAIAYKRVVYGLLGKPTIIVRAKGFREQRRTIENEEQGNKIAITLTSVPGTIIASTLPALANTRWLINGELFSIGKTFTRELEHGSYALQIDNPYFVIEDRPFEIKRAEKKEMNIELKQVSGQISILSNPPDATISIKGKEIGKTPYKTSLKGGVHSIVLEKDGYVTVKELITLSNTKDRVDRAYRMKRLPSTLTFSVEPEGGQLLLNGREVSPLGSYEVDSKTKHALTYTLEGFFPLTRNVILEEGEEKRINLLLKSETGKVDISAFPSADIYIDGIMVGKGTANLALSSVAHTVEFRKQGYRTIQKKFKPSSAHTTVIRERLMTELAARMAESPGEYKNSVGIELKLFEPNSFKMGAPRHQQGQRANEFEKNVVLKKSFYSSKREITNAQFKLFSKKHNGPVNQPAVSLTWLDAAKYCNWLSKREKLLPFYNIDNSKLRGVNSKADGYRLLTEAEWEWLARKAGRKEQTVFPWGNDSIVPKMTGNIADESANGLTRFYVPNYNDGFKELASVGEFPAEGSGLFDVTGNASEWVHDFYTLIPPDKKKVHFDPLGPEFGEGHVVKGSSWRSGTRTQLRASFREGLSSKRNDVGFRIGRYLYAEEVTSAH